MPHFLSMTIKDQREPALRPASRNWPVRRISWQLCWAMVALPPPGALPVLGRRTKRATAVEQQFHSTRSPGKKQGCQGGFNAFTEEGPPAGKETGTTHNRYKREEGKGAFFWEKTAAKKVQAPGFCFGCTWNAPPGTGTEGRVWPTEKSAGTRPEQRGF